MVTDGTSLVYADLGVPSERGGLPAFVPMVACRSCQYSDGELVRLNIPFFM